MPKAKQCEHGDAMIVEQSDLASAYKSDLRSFFYCPDCGVFIDEEGATLDFDPTEEATTTARSGASNLPKAPSLLPERKTQRAPIRDKRKRVEVICSWPKCHRWFLLWPQNVREKNYCPQEHRPTLKTLQARDRQRKFRQLQKQAQTASPEPVRQAKRKT